MFNRSCANVTLGIRAQSWSVLHLLAEYDPDFAPYEDSRYQCSIDTYPWYNGREKGFVLVLSKPVPKPDEPSLCLAFAECRGSDSIFVDLWGIDDYMGDPVDWHHSGYDAAYNHRAEFLNSQDAAHFIYKEMERWWNRTYGEKERKA